MNEFIGKANQIPKGIENACSDGLLRLFSIPAGNWVAEGAVEFIRRQT